MFVFNKAWKLLVSIFHLPFAIYIGIQWSRTIGYTSKQQYRRAYKVLISISQDVSENNAKQLLMRGYLALMLNKNEKAITCFDAFFSVIDANIRLSSEEKKYLKRYAADSYLSIPSEVEKHTVSEETLYEMSGANVNLQEVKPSIQRVFPFLNSEDQL